MDELTRHFVDTSHLFGSNSDWIEQLYDDYLLNPETVDKRWRSYFDSLQETGSADISHRQIQQQLLNEQIYAKTHNASSGLSGEYCLDPNMANKQVSVLRLINSYRTRGHQIADTDPINLRPKPQLDEFDPAKLGFTDADMSTLFNTGSLIAPEELPLAEIIQILRKIYCQSVGAEYMYLTELAEKRWIQARIEGPGEVPPMAEADQLELLRQITSAEGLEHYLHRKYVGQKRFGLEGGEALVPMLVDLIQQSGKQHVKEVTIAMAHRGRLNVLVNVVGKPPRELFDEFEGKGKSVTATGKLSGDVKYHLGYSAVTDTPGGPINTVLAFNPSHLEIVNPVVEGSVRARQRSRGDPLGMEVLPVIIHGDAAFAGQGVVMETFNMSQARGFKTGGTVHIVVNNQIGFTTSDPLDTFSTTYCTDVAKMVQAPIFHVNGDDPEAVLFVTRMALDYRMEYNKDVVIDLICYRRQGHNEADEPAVTQPMMYKKIRNHPTLRQIYAEKLEKQGTIPPGYADQMRKDYFKALDIGKPVAHFQGTRSDNRFRTNWKRFRGKHWTEPYQSALPASQIKSLYRQASRIPEGFELHPRVQKILRDRKKMAKGKLPLDWGFAETMAYASLLMEGYSVRLCGEDTGRGTFFHRHAEIHNQVDGAEWAPLQHISEDQADFIVINSLLSEEAVLAYEYGYAITDPQALVIWEAQFGDFANGAQVVIDQFISSAEDKWGRLCGLTLFLPHGYEGMGAEHSSARLERYLQLCAKENIQVCVPSQASQIFHLLRRQMLRPYRKPLIVITPKSLLRRREACSTIEELASGEYQLVIGEAAKNPQKVTGVILCSGRIFYPLRAKRNELGLENTVIIRLEQLYPFPLEKLKQELAQYNNLKNLVWCQEEPQNQGAWDQIKHRLHSVQKADQTLTYAGRQVSAAPATGIHRQHEREEQQLIQDAMEAASQ
ncbi:MAG: 2-oxoglutarate dehydrogenase E1 component [Gammaproteobacteria bacterium]|nr:MAG: 2-oxoglutarate dehydrogenase E1 component [Gammaproteobacteria bacterium]